MAAEPGDCNDKIEDLCIRDLLLSILAGLNDLAIDGLRVATREMPTTNWASVTA
jgi:hypothetical protein